MEIVLINPSFQRQKMGPLHKYVPAMIPLSLGFLAGYLLERKRTPVIVDEQLGYLSEAKVRELFAGKGCIMIGLSCLTAGAFRAYQLANWIRSINPEAFIVYGGVHATVLPQEVFEKGTADAVVFNEGEETLNELILGIEKGIPLENIKGIAFIRDGRIITTPPRPLIDDLNLLPLFPYDLFEKDRGSYNFGDLITSRGCPFECIFCSQRSISGRRYRYWSGEKIISQLDILINRYGQRNIIFNDDNLMVDRGHVIDLCERIIARGYPKGTSFLAMARADMVDQEILRLMKRAGFKTMAFGLETGSERLLKRIKKQITIEENRRAIRLTHESGIITSGSFILGLPGETRDESLSTIRFAKSIPLDLTRFNLLVPYPGTAVHEMIIQKKGTLARDWDSFLTVGGFGNFSLPYIPEGRSEQEMRRLQLWANISFYLRPRQFLAFIKGGYANQLKFPPILSIQGICAYLGIIFYLIISMLRTFIRDRQDSWHAARKDNI